MTEQELRQILIETEGPTPVVDALAIAGGARRVLSRRRHRRRGITLCVALLLLTLLLVRNQPERQIAERPSEELQSELAEIRAETARLQEEVELLLLEERFAKVERRSKRLASRRTPDEAQIESASAVLVYQADWLANRFGNRQSARQVYLQVVQIFPDTIGGEMARRRLVVHQ